MKKEFLNSLAAITAIVLLTFATTGCTKVSKKAVMEKAEKYLNENVVSGGVQVKALEANEKQGVYVIEFGVIQTSNQPSYGSGGAGKVYMSMDGNYLSLQPFFNTSKPPIPQKEKPEVRMFVMSACPYGVMAEKSMEPVIKALAGKIDFKPQYIVSSGYGSKEMCIEDNKYCSMHGVDEAKEDVRQLCIYQQQPDKWWDYINKFNADCYGKRDDKGKPNLSEECSKQSAEATGVDFEKVSKCFNDQYSAMLEKEMADAKQFEAQGSPTIIINGEVHRGGRDPNALLTAICSGFKNKPEACNQKLDVSPAQAAVPQSGGCG